MRNCSLQKSKVPALRNSGDPSLENPNPFGTSENKIFSFALIDSGIEMDDLATFPPSDSLAAFSPPTSSERQAFQ
jgi:hypothetical protein